MNGNHTSRHIRAISLALTMVVVLIAGIVLPACDGICCVTGDGGPSIHRQMPCCDETSSFSPREPLSTRPVAFAGITSAPQHTAAPVAIVRRSCDLVPPRVRTAFEAGSPAPEEPAPPLFLLNAQFLI